MALEHLLTGLLEFATNEQGSKSVVRALKEGGKEMFGRVVQRMCEPTKDARHAMIVDLARFPLVASVLPTADLHSLHLMIPAQADKEQRAALYDCIRVHIVTLRGCKTGSKVICLLYAHSIQFLFYPLACVFFSSDRMRAYYEY
ncbi:hypothetical protein DFH09DRAFT_1372061 [Mycena vulgaris]|nr:hypothetical protein DFH09DRAFT_1372061 [Mycena vulgaris]